MTTLAIFARCRAVLKTPSGESGRMYVANPGDARLRSSWLDATLAAPASDAAATCPVPNTAASGLQPDHIGALGHRVTAVQHQPRPISNLVEVELAVVRDAEGTVTKERLELAWDDATQRDRCLASLLADGLLVAAPGGYGLPG